MTVLHQPNQHDCMLKGPRGMLSRWATCQCTSSLQTAQLRPCQNHVNRTHGSSHSM
uniref:Uncharacterized protein n=1 Tax=Arundo donax TaxID=35708 RepID=A0A0A9H5D5_ARUDO